MTYKVELPDINITKKTENESKFVFEVEISDKLSKTDHLVTLKKEDYQAVKEKFANPEEFIKRAFQFLLVREPKDAIIKEFDLMQITDYYPEFEEQILNRYE